VKPVENQLVHDRLREYLRYVRSVVREIGEALSLDAAMQDMRIRGLGEQRQHTDGKTSLMPVIGQQGGDALCSPRTEVRKY
jgi:hypothetical protein